MSEFVNLPIELKSKIMYSGYVKHPVAVIFNEFVADYCDLMHNTFCLETMDYKTITFFDYLIETGHLKPNINNFFYDYIREYVWFD